MRGDDVAAVLGLLLAGCVLCFHVSILHHVGNELCIYCDKKQTSRLKNNLENTARVE